MWRSSQWPPISIRRCHLLQLRSRYVARENSLEHNRCSAHCIPASVAPIWCRGAKSRTTVKLNDLPQGSLPAIATPLEGEIETPKFPTVVQQAWNNMQRFENCVLLTRVGGFYELYLDQAEEYGPLLNLKVAHKKTTAGPVPMAGFPFFQLDRFLKTLVQDLNKFVAISEEFANNASGKVKSGGLLFDRKVTRIITPGTLIDEKFMDPYENNFLLAVHTQDPVELEDPNSDGGNNEPAVAKMTSQPVGLAWLDLSTGDFFTQITNLSSLSSDVARIGPREIILDQALQDFQDSGIMAVLEEDRHLITYHSSPSLAPSAETWDSLLENPVSAATHAELTPEEAMAGTSLLEYVKTRLQGIKMKLQPPIRKQALENMAIDKNTMRALELSVTMRDNQTKGSLLHAIRRTVTKSGTRLLKDWLTSPSTSLPVINGRLDLVSSFIEDPHLRDHIGLFLRRTYDSKRLVQKFSLGRGDADDLISISRTVEATKEIAAILYEKQHQHPSIDGSAQPGQGTSIRQSVVSIAGRLDLHEPSILSQRILAAIDEDGLSQQTRIEENEAAEVASMAREVMVAEGSEDDFRDAPKGRYKADAKAKEQDNNDDDIWIMCRSASPALEKLHDVLGLLRKEKIILVEDLRKRLGTSSLTLRWTPGLGHICHIRGKDHKASLEVLSKARSVSSSKTTRSFHLPEWTELGCRIDQAKLQIRAEEQRVFQGLRENVITNLVKLRRNAAVLDELDVACSNATLAEEQRLVRPILNLGTSHKVASGRHPTVELGLDEKGRSFTANDCFVGEQERIWLITGPNMAGKSTFLRQNALISILAQTGSYVPAEFAEIGIVDKIFSRVGSADNLSQDQSTFMVEMLETAEILKQATPRSFVIMDEVGRGTTPEDGIAISYACLHHLYTHNQSRVLFATHFHVLARLTSHMKRLACYCTDLKEDDKGGFMYVRRLRRGVNDRSHALKVARVAGLPQEAINTARQVLDKLSTSSYDP